MEDRLRKLVRLIDAGSFTAAARDMHVSQPSLSVAIAKLERELRAPLIVRGARPLTLTLAGQLAYTAGRDMLIKNANLKTQLAELANRELSVSIGMIDSMASTLLASSSSVDNLERQATVSLVVDNSRNLLQAVAAGHLDVAFVVERRSYEGAIQIAGTAREPLVIVCSPDFINPLRNGKLHRFISYDQASTTHSVIMEQLAAQRITAEPTFYSTSPEVMLRLVLKGRGVAVLPYLLVKEYIGNGELVTIGRSSPQITRPIHAVRRRDMVLPAPLVHMVAEMSGLLTQLSDEVSRLTTKST